MFESFEGGERRACSGLVGVSMVAPKVTGFSKFAAIFDFLAVTVPFRGNVFVRLFAAK
jgi:hypothetical protein